MGDIFLSPDLRRVLKGKSLLFIGDSILRNIYKDFIWLSEENSFTPDSHMRRKGEASYRKDKLVDGTALTTGRDYRECRDWYDPDYDIQFSFIFITRIYSRMLWDILEDYPSFFGSYPDFIVINACLWDINRWGPSGIEHFRSISSFLFFIFSQLSNLGLI